MKNSLNISDEDKQLLNENQDIYSKIKLTESYYYADFKLVWLSGFMVAFILLYFSQMSSILPDGGLTLALNSTFFPIGKLQVCNNALTCIKNICNIMNYTEEVGWVAINPNNWKKCGDISYREIQYILYWITFGNLIAGGIILLLNFAWYFTCYKLEWKHIKVTHLILNILSKLLIIGAIISCSIFIIKSNISLDQYFIVVIIVLFGSSFVFIIIAIWRDIQEIYKYCSFYDYYS